MKKVLHIAEPVLTGDLLRQLHDGQQELCCVPGVVITPTGWDYIRQFQLQVSRGTAAPSAAPQTPIPSAVSPSAIPAGDRELIREVSPQMVSLGQCDQPDQPYGCRTDEFGSGFAAIPQQPHNSQENPVHQQQTALFGASDVEMLVQQITNLVIEELAGQ